MAWQTHGLEIVFCMLHLRTFTLTPPTFPSPLQLLSTTQCPTVENTADLFTVFKRLCVEEKDTLVKLNLHGLNKKHCFEGFLLRVYKQSE